MKKPRKKIKHKIRCEKCNDFIIGKIAYFNCKQYCSFCFDSLKIRTNHKRRPLRVHWEAWLKKGKSI